jgi:hypothetical protein
LHNSLFWLLTAVPEVLLELLLIYNRAHLSQWEFHIQQLLIRLCTASCLSFLATLCPWPVPDCVHSNYLLNQIIFSNKNAAHGSSY